MLNNTIALWMIFFSMIIVAGCSSHHQKSVTYPEFQSDLPSSFVDEDKINTNHSIAGYWSLDFDPETLEISTSDVSIRNTEMHFNVAPFLPPPDFVVNSFDPWTGVLDVDATITNSFNVNDHYCPVKIGTIVVMGL